MNFFKVVQAVQEVSRNDFAQCDWNFFSSIYLQWKNEMQNYTHIMSKKFIELTNFYIIRKNNQKVLFNREAKCFSLFFRSLFVQLVSFLVQEIYPIRNDEFQILISRIKQEESAYLLALLTKKQFKCSFGKNPKIGSMSWFLGFRASSSSKSVISFY